MLIIKTRGECLQIGEATVWVERCKGSQMILSIEAPKAIRITRDKDVWGLCRCEAAPHWNGKHFPECPKSEGEA